MKKKLGAKIFEYLLCSLKPEFFDIEFFFILSLFRLTPIVFVLVIWFKGESWRRGGKERREEGRKEEKIL